MKKPTRLALTALCALVILAVDLHVGDLPAPTTSQGSASAKTASVADWSQHVITNVKESTWIENATDPENVVAALQTHWAKVPQEFHERLQFAAPDGRFAGLIQMRTRHSEAQRQIIEAGVQNFNWVGQGSLAVAIIPPDSLPALLEMPFVEEVHPDSLVTAASADSAFATGARGTATNPSSSMWRYDTADPNNPLGRLGSQIVGSPTPLAGKGIGVAVIDSGVDTTHPDFGGWACENDRQIQTEQACEIRVKRSVVVNPWLEDQAVEDEAGVVVRQGDDSIGHGTHTAGIIAGNAYLTRANDAGSASGHFFGQAPEAEIVSINIAASEPAFLYAVGVPVFAAQGEAVGREAWLSFAMAGLRWAFDHADDQDYRVVLLAWSCHNHFYAGAPSSSAGACITPPAAYSEMVRGLYEKGLPVIVPVGNGRPGGADGRETVPRINAFAQSPFVVAVGAYDDATLRMAPFSADGSTTADVAGLTNPTTWDPYSESVDPATNRYLRPDILAPGQAIHAPAPWLGSTGYENPHRPQSIVDVPPPAPRQSVTGSAGQYHALHGTSMAAAHVAGAMVLLVQACPAASTTELYRSILVGARSGRILKAAGSVVAPVSLAGYGELDVRASLNWLMTVRPDCLVDFSHPRLSAIQTEHPGPFFEHTQVNFTVNVQTASGPQPTYGWKFGDGTASADVGETTHVYETPGLYMVSVTVTDHHGARAIETMHVRIMPNPTQTVPPIQILSAADFAAHASSGTGTASNPYVIENKRIEVPLFAAVDQPAIRIEGVAAHVKLRNIAVVAEGESSESPDPGLRINAIGGRRGIEIRNAQNVTLSDVTVCGWFVPRDATLNHQLDPADTATTLQRYDGTPIITSGQMVPLFQGIYVRDSANIQILDTTVCNIARARGAVATDGTAALSVIASRDVTVSDALISNNILDGILVSGSTRTILSQSVISGNAGRGVVLQDMTAPLRVSDWSKIFDNILSHNLLGDASNASVGKNNRWYTDPTPGPNVMGGPIIGGNRWGRPGSMADANGDGILDLPQAVPGSTTNKDQYPLSDHNHAPTAAFTFTHAHAGVRRPLAQEDAVSFATQSTDPDGIVTTWVWDLGDGSSVKTTNSTSPAPTRVYPTGGVYTARLRVVDDEGRVSSPISTNININSRPSANFTSKVTSNLVVNLKAVDAAGGLSHDPDGDALTFAWDCGPGVLSTTPEPTELAKCTFTSVGDCTIALIVSDGEVTGQASTTIFVDDVDKPPFVELSASQATVLSNVPVQFEDDTQAAAIVTWNWDFGDGNTSTEQHPQHTYTDGGRAYAVMLTVTDEAGHVASNDAPLTITVLNRSPASLFEWTAPEGASTLVPIQFSDASSDQDGHITTRTWEFGDATTYTAITGALSSPAHIYQRAGTYQVNLTVRDEDGATHRSTQVLTVANTPPLPDFAWTPETPTTADTVQFHDASLDPDGTLNLWTWTFPDGSTQTGPQPVKKFTSNGPKLVKLVVRDDEGASVEKTLTVLVQNLDPSADFEFSPRQPSVGQAVQFDASRSSDDGTITECRWAFGDGSTAGTCTATNTYETPDLYPVTLTLRDEDGGETSLTKQIRIFSTAPAVAFRWTVEPTAIRPTTSHVIRFEDLSTDADGTIQVWNWNLGDGTTYASTTKDNASPPPHRYGKPGTYLVVLDVQDNNGLWSTRQTYLGVENTLPVTKFEYTPENVSVAAPVQFEANATDHDGSIISWYWDFGDGHQSRLPDPTHNFTQKRAHTVRLTVVDDFGGIGTTTQVVSPGNAKPTVTISWTPLAPRVGQPVHFSANASDEDGVVVSFSWTTTDGAQADTRDFEHAFTRPGTANVTLTITDDDGATRSVQSTLSVAGTPIGLAIAADNPNPLPGQQVRFTATGAADDASANWTWRFGDGMTSHSRNPSHAYVLPGRYDASLTITTTGGARPTANATILVKTPPKQFEIRADTDDNGSLSFALPPGTAHAEDTVTWDFGDGNTSNDPAPNHTYARPGAYLVVVTVTGASGGSTVKSYVVEVAPTPAQTRAFPVADPAPAPAGGLVAVLVALLVGTMQRRRKTGGQP